MVNKLRFGVLATMVVFCSACVPLNQTPAVKENNKNSSHQKLERILTLSDYSERAYAYHEFCVGNKEPMNDRFLENFKIISNMLLDEFIATLNWQPQYTVDQITERRRNIQRALLQHYQEGGCETPEAREAQGYYDMLGKQDRASIVEYVTNKR